jgi:hypothetical protein
MIASPKLTELPSHDTPKTLIRFKLETRYWAGSLLELEQMNAEGSRSSGIR